MATTPAALEGNELAPPYLAFTTFQAAIDNLRTHGLPDPIDRTTWDSRSGSDQVQIFGALRFLGLLGDGNHPTDTLRGLVDASPNTPAEKGLVKTLVLNRYTKVFDRLDLKTATPGQLEEAIGSYGIGGRTKERAVRFFLKAANHAGIELSSRLTKNLRSRPSSTANGITEEESANGENPATPSPQRPSRKRRRSTSTPQNTIPAEGNQSVTGNAMKTVTLPGVKGTLTISGTFNAFGLSGDERKLVYDIIDMMNAFEGKAGGAQ